MSLSNQLRDRSRRVMPGGGGTAGSSFFASAEGVRLSTVDGRTLVDFTAACGSLILGSGNEAVERAVKAACERGLYPGLRSEDEVRLAELLVSYIPFLDAVVLSDSGSRAIRSAADIARRITGRKTVLYAGQGRAADLASDAKRIPYNDLAAASAAFSSRKGRIAAVLVEPIASSIGVAEPAAGYLKGLRDLCDAGGAFLVFDERISAFRFGLSDYASFCGVRPDLVCLGGIVGGGFPIGALGGSREALKEAASFAEAGSPAHPAAIAAGVAVLLELERTDPYDRLDLYARRIREELNAFAAENDMDFRVANAGGVFSPFFRKERVVTEADAENCDVGRYGMFARRLLDRGWLVPASRFAPCFVSAAHEDGEIDGFIEACRLTLDEVFETV